MGQSAEGTLTVRAAGQHLGLPLQQIAEILRVPHLTRVPLAPPALVGVANLRGQMLPVVCLAALTGEAGADPTAASRVIVMDLESTIGLLVDEVLAFGATHDGAVLDIGALLASQFTTLPTAAGPGRAYAAPVEATPARDPGLALIGLHLAGQDFAIPLADVSEIIPLPARFIPVPGTDPAMLGVIDSRAGLLPLLSLRVLLGLPPDGYDLAKARIVVAYVAGRLAGLVADTATSIFLVPADCIEPVPLILSRGQPEAKVAAICRLEGRLVSQLSTGSLLDQATTARLLAIAPEASSPGQQAAAEGAQFVVVQLGGSDYGIPVAAVDEVVRHPGMLTRVPYAPGFVEGAMNLRGKIIPVIDQAQCLGMAAAEGPSRRIIVLHAGAMQAGFAVDAASELLTVNDVELSPAPALTTGHTQVFDRIATLQRDGRMILLMNPDMMLGEVERGMVESAA